MILHRATMRRIIALTCFILYCDGLYTKRNEGERKWREHRTHDNVVVRRSSDTPSLTETFGGNGESAICKFPFIYDGTSYFDCLPTKADNTRRWCATTHNYDANARWGYCCQSGSCTSKHRSRRSKGAKRTKAIPKTLAKLTKDLMTVFGDIKAWEEERLHRHSDGKQNKQKLISNLEKIDGYSETTSASEKMLAEKLLSEKEAGEGSASGDEFQAGYAPKANKSDDATNNTSSANSGSGFTPFPFMTEVSSSQSASEDPDDKDDDDFESHTKVIENGHSDDGNVTVSELDSMIISEGTEMNKPDKGSSANTAQNITGEEQVHHHKPNLPEAEEHENKFPTTSMLATFSTDNIGQHHTTDGPADQELKQIADLGQDDDNNKPENKSSNSEGSDQHTGKLEPTQIEMSSHDEATQKEMDSKEEKTHEEKSSQDEATQRETSSQDDATKIFAQDTTTKDQDNSPAEWISDELSGPHETSPDEHHDNNTSSTPAHSTLKDEQTKAKNILKSSDSEASETEEYTEKNKDVFAAYANATKDNSTDFFQSDFFKSDNAPVDHTAGNSTPAKIVNNPIINIGKSKGPNPNQGPIKTFGGNAHESACVFPFVYEETTYESCTKEPRERDWCATTSNYDRDARWGYCCYSDNCVQDLREMTEKQDEARRLAKLKEQQKQKRLEKVTLAKVLKQTEKASPTSKKEDIEEIRTIGGNGLGKSCIFPFVYDGSSHYTCLPSNDFRMWCSVTSNYDKDASFGYCCDDRGGYRTKCEFQELDEAPANNQTLVE